jgi:hypothetical protein
MSLVVVSILFLDTSCQAKLGIAINLQAPCEVLSVMGRMYPEVKATTLPGGINSSALYPYQGKGSRPRGLRKGPPA